MVILDEVDFKEDWIMKFSEFLDIGKEFLKGVDYTLEDEGKKSKRRPLDNCLYIRNNRPTKRSDVNSF